MLLAGLGVFCAAFALDFASTRYIRAVGNGAVHAAGVWSVVMCLLSSVALLALVDVSVWMLAPECAGLYLGTVATAVRISRK